MTIRKEGLRSIFTMLAIAIALVVVVICCSSSILWICVISTLSLLFFVTAGFLLFFYRNPSREALSDKNLVLAPADGTVISIEEKYFEQEYFKKEMTRISIFMSPMNVHVNSYPISGEVVYAQYHKGKHYMANLPKSSTDNERNTVVVRSEAGHEVLFRQIAGMLARRIVSYAEVGKKAEQGKNMGVIKLGSRVDVFVPVGTKLLVEELDCVRSKKTPIASWERE